MERGPACDWRHGEGLGAKRRGEVPKRDSECIGFQVGRVVGPGFLRRGLHRETGPVRSSQNR